MDLDGRCFVRKGNALVPADIHAEAFLHGVKEGREIVISAHVPRNPKFHRWFFALLHKVCGSVRGWNDEEELLDAIKHAVGHTQQRSRLDGARYWIPRSISFASMGEDKFRRFVQRALYVLNVQFGIDGEALMEEVDREQGMSIGKRAHRPVPPEQLSAEAGKAA